MSRFEEALSSLVKVKIATDIHHPLDLSIFYEADAYIARCHLALGNEKDARYHAQKALDNIAPIPNTPYKDFIIETYERITK